MGYDIYPYVYLILFLPCMNTRAHILKLQGNKPWTRVGRNFPYVNWIIRRWDFFLKDTVQMLERKRILLRRWFYAQRRCKELPLNDATRVLASAMTQRGRENRRTTSASPGTKKRFLKLVELAQERTATRSIVAPGHCQDSSTAWSRALGCKKGIQWMSK